MLRASLPSSVSARARVRGRVCKRAFAREHQQARARAPMRAPTCARTHARAHARTHARTRARAHTLTQTNVHIASDRDRGLQSCIYIFEYTPRKGEARNVCPKTRSAHATARARTLATSPASCTRAAYTRCVRVCVRARALVCACVCVCDLGDAYHPGAPPQRQPAVAPHAALRHRQARVPRHAVKVRLGDALSLSLSLALSL